MLAVGTEQTNSQCTRCEIRAYVASLDGPSLLVQDVGKVVKELYHSITNVLEKLLSRGTLMIHAARHKIPSSYEIAYEAQR